jgi:catechol 2,3-dioxygenase-like lactoylglutathione lyase family enzyme
MLQSVYPVLCSSDLDRSIDFYRRLLDLDVVFECGWYATLRPRDGQSPQVGLVEVGHATLPAARSAVVRLWCAPQLGRQPWPRHSNLRAPRLRLGVSRPNPALSCLAFHCQ